jgi:hypothetical protein
MGIEPTRTARSELENIRFGAMANLKCDWRVNFRGMWGHVGIRRWAKSRARAYQSEVSERPTPEIQRAEIGAGNQSVRTHRLPKVALGKPLWLAAVRPGALGAHLD